MGHLLKVLVKTARAKTVLGAVLLAIVTLEYAVDAAIYNSGKYADDRVVGLPYKAGEQPLHESYSGHITVRTWTPEGGAPKDSGSAKLFYWYFPAIAPKVEEPPLLLWIQGGPGSSSMIGLLTEMGPLALTDDGEFTRRNMTWANHYDLLVVDQPAGTGFSSVSPRANLTLDDLFPMANMMPKSVVDSWKAEYPGNVNDYKFIKSPMTIEFIVAEAQDMLRKLMHPLVKLSSKTAPFGEMFTNVLKSRQSEIPDVLSSIRRSIRFHEHTGLDQVGSFSLPKDGGSDDNSDDPFLVNSGYAEERENKTVWEKIGLTSDESGDFVNGYATNMRAVGKDMWTFMQIFFEQRPALRKRDFYVFSESYGGKYVPAIATYIDHQNVKFGKDNLQAVNLRGVSIGNSLVHPVLQILAHGSIGFAWGLLDVEQADTIDLLAFKAINHTLNGDLEAGNEIRLLMFDYFRNITGGVNWYDIRRRNHSYKRTYLDQGLNNPVVREALNTKDIAYGVDHGVYYYLSGDIMRTTAPLFPTLLNKYSVHLNQGQFDFRDGVAGNTLWINGLKWPDRSKFSLADRQQWWLEKELVGYTRSGGNLSHWVILNAGHMSPGDQPEACLDMARRIVLL
ncbi:hypothetical protein LPJ66_004679 [Kickxella alabastrina]|uniref:Uncharacterized protein n=1 Tax=Kickxella alabastrina TaxID=61397 RepID=A0ACC1IGV5_9FUNG|nr:hypothetical protein LPJ66_004679 [Kickxella alabastrina]